MGAFPISLQQRYLCKMDTGRYELRHELEDIVKCLDHGRNRPAPLGRPARVLRGQRKAHAALYRTNTNLFLLP
jgi:hypothetical protein